MTVVKNVQQLPNDNCCSIWCSDADMIQCKLVNKYKSHSLNIFIFNP